MKEYQAVDLAIDPAFELHPVLVYWAAIRMLGHGTSGEWGHCSPPDVMMWDALERWRKGHPDIWR